MFDIQNIFGQFDVEGDFVKASELGSGHINDTFLVETASKNVYVLQRVNPFVFADISNLIKNKIAVSNHLLSKFENLSTEELRRRVLVFAQTTTQENYHRDLDGYYWNLTFYIKDCVNYLKAPPACRRVSTKILGWNSIASTRRVLTWPFRPPSR